MDFYERTIGELDFTVHWLSFELSITVCLFFKYVFKDYGPMNNFLNFGSGMLWPFGGKVFYNHTFRGISVEQCAQRCLDERKFRCASFDYLHDKDLNFCLLSDTSVMAGHANLSNVTLANCNHFERIGPRLVWHFRWNICDTRDQLIFYVQISTCACSIRFCTRAPLWGKSRRRRMHLQKIAPNNALTSESSSADPSITRFSRQFLFNSYKKFLNHFE